MGGPHFILTAAPKGAAGMSHLHTDDKTDPEGDSVAWGGGSLKVLWLHGGFVLGATSSQPLERQPWCRRGLGAARGPCHPSPNPSTPRLALASGLVL